MCIMFQRGLSDEEVKTAKLMGITKVLEQHRNGQGKFAGFNYKITDLLDEKAKELMSDKGYKAF